MDRSEKAWSLLYATKKDKMEMMPNTKSFGS
jgi:hypothetical protein